MSIIKSEAIIIKQFDIGESDKIITSYTKDYGKIRAVAKGVRKSRSSMSGIVLPFNYNYVTFYQGRSLDKINQVQNIFSFVKLREDLIKMAYASFMAEFIEKVGMENDPNPALFSLLLSNFHQLLVTDNDELKYIELVYKIRLLTILGLKPEIDTCISCNKDLRYYKKNIFDIKLGGLICQPCYVIQKKPMSPLQKFVLLGEAVTILKKILNSGLEPLKNLKIPDNSFQQLDNLANKFITYHLELKLNSYEFLNMIKDLG